MKRYLIVLIIAGILFPVSAEAQKKSRKKSVPKTKGVETASSMKNELDSVSYAFGMLIGMNMKDVGFEDFNYALFTNAIRDVITAQPNKFDNETARFIVNNYVGNLMNRETSENLDNSTKYLEENSRKEGVITLESGLQYQILEEGAGPKPGPESKVVVHYTGMLTDGTIFDSSYDNNEPVVIPLNMVIQGWSEALQLMPVGSKWMIFIPPHLGYAEMSPPGSPIKSNSVLIFEVKLLDIEQ